MWTRIRNAIRQADRRGRDRRDYETLLHHDCSERLFKDIDVARAEVERLYRNTWLR